MAVPGEIPETVDQYWARFFKDSLDRLQADVTEMKRDLKEEARLSHERRITALEDQAKWLIRTVGGVLLAGGLGAVYFGGK